MRVCCGLTNHLELAKRPDLYGGPVVGGAGGGGESPIDKSEHVIAASEEALPFGVTPGMPLRQAEHLCPQATFIARDPIAAARLRELISIALYDLAPVVEVRVEGIAWLDVSGVVKLGEAIRDARRRSRMSSSPGARRSSRARIASSSRRWKIVRRCSSSRARCATTSPLNLAFVALARNECACGSSTNQTSLMSGSPPCAIRFRARPSCSD